MVYEETINAKETEGTSSPPERKEKSIGVDLEATRLDYMPLEAQVNTLKAREAALTNALQVTLTVPLPAS